MPHYEFFAQLQEALLKNPAPRRLQGGGGSPSALQQGTQNVSQFGSYWDRRARTIGLYREKWHRALKTSKETAAEWCVSFASSRLDSMCHDRRGRKPPAVTLSEQELLMLKRLTERPKYQGPLTRRARMILACAEGKPDTVVAQETGMCVHEVTKWRARFLALR